MKKILVILLSLVCIGSLIGNVLLYQRYSTTRPMLRIGNEVIKLKDYQDKMDNDFGRDVLNRMVLEIVVMQEAKRLNVVPTDADVKARIAMIDRRSPKMLEAAKLDPRKMEQMERQTKANIALENITIKDTKVSEKDIREFYEKNKGFFALPMQARSTIAVATTAVAARTAESLLKRKGIDLATIAAQPGTSVIGFGDFQMDWKQVPPAVQSQLGQLIAKTPTNGVATLITPTISFAVRVEENKPEGVVPYEKAKPEVERLVKLMKSTPQYQVLGKLYKDAGVRFEIPKYSVFFKDLEAAAANATQSAPEN